jgi:hypothetical protein
MLSEKLTCALAGAAVSVIVAANRAAKNMEFRIFTYLDPYIQLLLVRNDPLPIRCRPHLLNP